MAQQKLYTEEQVRDAIKSALDGFGIGDTKDTVDVIVSNLTPIELPSDEEIEEGLFHQSNEYAYGYKDAFKWMREQILNK